MQWFRWMFGEPIKLFWLKPSMTLWTLINLSFLSTTPRFLLLCLLDVFQDYKNDRSNYFMP
jgi:hypothetical protein